MVTNARWGMAAFIVVAGMGLTFVLAWSEEYKNEADEALSYNVTRTVKTVKGLNFVVEEDRPIEKVGSGYRPIDIDSYVALKITKLQKSVDEKLAAFQDRLAALEAEVATLKFKNTTITPTAPPKS